MAYLHGTGIKVTPLHPDGRVRPEYKVVLLRDVQEGEEWRTGTRDQWQNYRPNYDVDRWVEVRKATPKFENIPWHEAAGRMLLNGDFITDVSKDRFGVIHYSSLVGGRHDRQQVGRLIEGRDEFTVRVED